MAVLVLIIICAVVFAPAFSKKINDVEESDWGSKELVKNSGGYILLVIVAVVVMFFLFAASQKPNSEINRDPNYHNSVDANWDDVEAPSHSDANNKDWGYEHRCKGLEGMKMAGC